LTFWRRHKHWCINAIVVMPTGMHMIVFDAEFDTKRLLPTLLDFRKFTGRQRSGYGRDHLPGCFPKTLRERATADRKRRFWQQKLEGIHNNPCRSGLVRAPEY
jgi:hypothetical protein